MERLPGSMQSAARAAYNLGITQEATTQALFKAMEASKLHAETFLPELSKELMISANRGNALEKAMQTTASAIGRFQTNVWLANKTMNEAGLDRGIRRMINATSDAIMRSDSFWRFMGQTLEVLTDAIRGPMELLGALGERFQAVEKFAESLGLQTNELAGIFLALFKWGRRILFVFWLLPAAMSGLAKIIDGEKLSWAEWAITIGGVAMGLRSVYKLLKKVRDAKRGKFTPDAPDTPTPRRQQATPSSEKTPSTSRPKMPSVGVLGKIGLGVAAFEGLRELLSGGEIMGGDGWSVRAPNLAEMIEKQKQLPPLLGPHGGIQPGQLPFGEVRVERIDINVNGSADAKETAEQTYLIFKDEVRKAATSSPIEEK